ncbi:hypothetical protein EDB81DRAFT_904360 [Dactylonectria macrodidyma]|uniref:GST N-terminal domain-containing protein n=1 Tax=Dactylonectria macrodidyma TaxID=307937 RepID=A0A9P9EB52_9HYPO|nr:hypothetical protein EDB81DRAFT_904360 [Dactylonectria macrodidyma]
MLDVVNIDIMKLENRGLEYRTQVNLQGELPALVLDNGFILTEMTAICEYLDKVAKGGKSLFGETSAERAETRMWLRRMDLEIAQPVIAWVRNDPADVHFYALMKGKTTGMTPCILDPGRKNVVAYFERMDAREASKKALEVFGSRVVV